MTSPQNILAKPETLPGNGKVPVQAGAPWPTFRHDGKNTARSSIRAAYTGDHPWLFQTGKGIFSTPIIDRTGTIYVGSADHHFYALNPNGSQKWRFETGEIIDSAGALPEVDEEKGATIIFPSGDGYLYCVQAEQGELIWKFDARTSPRASYNNWWEANVAIGPNGTIYAGNTNFNYYAIAPDGTFKWAYETGANAWSIAAFADDGTIFWGSCDTFFHAVHSANGQSKWKKQTLGFVTASAAIGTDGMVYMGSFDSNLYALDPDNGRVKWKFKTQDHIYSSAALGVDESGQTNAIYFASTDGSLYALDPQGKLLWRYDAGAPIRSSPVLGRAPEGEEGWIVYFGCGNGKLFAINAADGSRRWSYNTTPEDPELCDRNDLNGSPALGTTGVYIGGEHGQVWYVPYDYPLHSDDPRGSRDAGEDFPSDMAGLLYVTPGGNVALTPPESLPAATIITLQLKVRKQGETVDARLYNTPFFKPRNALNISINPSVDFQAETSADGRHLHIIPHDFLETGKTYEIRVEGNTYTGGLSIGNLTIGGRKSGRFAEVFSFAVDEPAVDQIPLEIKPDQVTAFEWTRLSVPIPAMLPSLNQIGFDYMDWIIGVVEMTEPDSEGRGKAVLWTVGGKHDEDGALVTDSQTDFLLPLSGWYQRDAFMLTNHNFNMAVTGIPIPFNTFQLRGQMGVDLRVRPSATAYGDTKVLSIPTFGPIVVIAGLANNWWQKLLAMATYVTRPYGDGPANQLPEGIEVDSVQFSAPTRSKSGEVLATFKRSPGVSCPLDKHYPAILLVDQAKTEAVQLDYLANISSTADDDGNLTTVKLSIPAGITLPEKTSVIILLDVFPLHRETL